MTLSLSPGSWQFHWSFWGCTFSDEISEDLGKANKRERVCCLLWATGEMEGGGKGGIRKKKIGNKKTGEFTVTEDSGIPLKRDVSFCLWMVALYLMLRYLKGPQSRCCWVRQPYIGVPLHQWALLLLEWYQDFYTPPLVHPGTRIRHRKGKVARSLPSQWWLLVDQKLCPLAVSAGVLSRIAWQHPGTLDPIWPHILSI